MWADAAAALVVAVIIVRAAGMLTWRSGDILIDRAPAGAEENLRDAIRDVDGVREVRSVRVRRSGPNLIGDASIATGRMLSVEAASALVEDVKARARSVLPQLDLAVSVEDRSSAPTWSRGFMPRPRETAGARPTQRDGRARGRWVTSPHDAREAARDQTVAEASSVSRDLERSIRAELPEVMRIDIHLEPMEPEVVPGRT